MSAKTLSQSDLPGVPLLFRGKVRDIYDLGDKLLLVATDRLSAFDVVLPTPIPDKGRVLTQLSAFWFGKTESIVPNHLISTDVSEYPDPLPKYADQIEGRSMLVKKARRIDVECVVRGYITGSAWSEYRKSGTVAGLSLPAGLRESEPFSEPIFTPSTKADSGHDENISVAELESRIGKDLAQALSKVSIALYSFARDYALSRGIFLADTKFEFGFYRSEGESEERLILIDEALTPDSSRFWPADSYQIGQGQPSFDKQYVRDWLQSSGWNKEPPAPELSADVVERTAAKYRDALDLLTRSED